MKEDGFRTAAQAVGPMSGRAVRLPHALRRFSPTFREKRFMPLPVMSPPDRIASIPIREQR
jgi:hypothetical protein